MQNQKFYPLAVLQCLWCMSAGNYLRPRPKMDSLHAAMDIVLRLWHWYIGCGTMALWYYHAMECEAMQHREKRS